VQNTYYRWTTHDLKTFDNVPIVGKIDNKYPEVLIATGFKGWGITNTMAAARLLADTIEGKENSWSALYDPSRTSTIFSSQLISYNVPTVARLVAENIKNYPEAFGDLKNGRGDIYEIDNKKLAVYRDETGEIHAFAANCTHMGCIVHFNEAETTWDCPCHGSRFDINGEVIHSPAAKKLKKY
jgi:Rieske Fe-S protein